MKQLVIGDIVSRAWDLAVKHWPIFVALSIINALLSNAVISYDPGILAGITSSEPKEIIEAYSEALSFNPLTGTIAFLLGIYLAYISYNLYVNAYTKGKPYEKSVDILKADFQQLAIYFCVNFVYGIIVAVGCVFCLLPGIWLGVRLWYAPLLAATQGASFNEAFSRSWKMTEGHFWKLFLMGLTMIGIALLGFCACIVGYYFAAVITYFMLVVSFYVLNPEEQAAPADAPATSADYEEVQ